MGDFLELPEQPYGDPDLRQGVSHVLRRISFDWVLRESALQQPGRPYVQALGNWIKSGSFWLLGDACLDLRDGLFADSGVLREGLLAEPGGLAFVP